MRLAPTIQPTSSEEDRAPHSQHDGARVNRSPNRSRAGADNPPQTKRRRQAPLSSALLLSWFKPLQL